MSDEITSAELSALTKWAGAQAPEEKHSVHSFLLRVATSNDTTKVGNLNTDELGIPKLSLRSYKELALISDKILENSYFNDYYTKKAELVTSTSLSKDAKLLNLSVVQKREIADVTEKPKENKGWFRSKNKPENLNITT